MKSHSLPGAVAACALTLGGCAAVDRLMETGAPPAAPAPVVAAPAVAAVPEPAPADWPPKPKRKPDIVDPKTLVGLDKAAISALFGAPHGVSEEDPAQVWTWRTDGCEMRVYLYPDVASRTFKALAYEVRATETPAASVVAETCPSRLKWAQSGTGD